LLTYSGTVTNTGNVTLNNVFVVDNQPVPNTPVLGPITLAPGAGASFTGSYTVPSGVCSTSDTLTATGINSSTSAAVVSTVTVTCPVSTTPGISITESCPAPVGGLASYSGVVSNTGNVTLTNVFVVSSKPNNNTPVLGPITLAPGASAPFSGSFATPVSPAPIDLGSASSFAVLAGAGITVAGAVNSTAITGDIGTSPTPSITGLGNVILTGTNHGADATTQTAKTDLVTAYNAAAGRAATLTYGPIFDLGGETLQPGVYRNPSSFGITGTLTLDALGDPNAVWIFQMGSTLTTASGSSVTLINGAQAANVFWQVGSSATLGTGSNLKGTIMAMDSITLTTGASLTGRALARNAVVTMDVNSIAIPQLNVVPPNNTVTATGLDTCLARTVTASANCPGFAGQLLQAGAGSGIALLSVGGSSAQHTGAPIITSILATKATVTLSWSARAGVIYRIQSTSGASNSIWMDVPGEITSSGAAASKSVPIESSPMRFYRVLVVQE
jgi:hypothetical protein